MNPLGWTPDRVNTLRKLHAEGNSASIIALRLGSTFTRNAVIGKIHRLGLASRTTVVRASPGALPLNPTRRQVKRNKHGKVVSVAPVEFKPDPVETLKTIADLMKNAETLPLPAVPDVPSGTVDLLDLEPHHCRYVFGDGPYFFCAKDRAPKSSYCSVHDAICHGPYRPPRKYADSPVTPMWRAA